MFTFDYIKKFGLDQQVDFLHGTVGPAPDMTLNGETVRELDQYLSAQSTTPYYTIGSEQGGAYMARDWLIEKSEHKPAARIHTIFRSDLDRAAHNHPWNNVSVILHGCYYELAPAKDGVEDLSIVPSHVLGGCSNIEPMKAILRKPGDVVCRTFETRHKLLVPPGEYAVTLFMSGPTKVEWGFFTENGFVLHTDYLIDA